MQPLGSHTTIPPAGRLEWGDYGNLVSLVAIPILLGLALYLGSQGDPFAYVVGALGLLVLGARLYKPLFGYLAPHPTFYGFGRMNLSRDEIEQGGHRSAVVLLDRKKANSSDWIRFGDTIVDRDVFDVFTVDLSNDRQQDKVILEARWEQICNSYTRLSRVILVADVAESALAVAMLTRDWALDTENHVDLDSLSGSRLEIERVVLVGGDLPDETPVLIGRIEGHDRITYCGSIDELAELTCFRN